MKQKKRDSRKAFIVKSLAEKYGVSKRFVYMVLSGDKDNEQILSDYMQIHESTNLLLQAVIKAVPFN